MSAVRSVSDCPCFAAKSAADRLRQEHGFVRTGRGELGRGFYSSVYEAKCVAAKGPFKVGDLVAIKELADSDTKAAEDEVSVLLTSNKFPNCVHCLIKFDCRLLVSERLAWWRGPFAPSFILARFACQVTNYLSERVGFEGSNFPSNTSLFSVFYGALLANHLRTNSRELNLLLR